MNRRDMIVRGLQSLAAIPLFQRIGYATEVINDRAPKCSMLYPSDLNAQYEVVWTGWKPDGYSGEYVGQWMAMSLDYPSRLNCYASYPGSEGTYNRGDFFDIGLRLGQDLIGLQTTEDEKVRACQETLARLMDVVHSQGE